VCCLAQPHHTCLFVSSYPESSTAHVPDVSPFSTYCYVGICIASAMPVLHYARQVRLQRRIDQFLDQGMCRYPEQFVSLRDVSTLQPTNQPLDINTTGSLLMRPDYGVPIRTPPHGALTIPSFAPQSGSESRNGPARAAVRLVSLQVFRPLNYT
jgi:hypothetical protein